MENTQVSTSLWPATLSKGHQIPWSGSGKWELLLSQVVSGFLMGVGDQLTSIDIMGVIDWVKEENRKGWRGVCRLSEVE